MDEDLFGLFGMAWILGWAVLAVIAWHLRASRRQKKWELIHKERLTAMEKGGVVGVAGDVTMHNWWDGEDLSPCMFRCVRRRPPASSTPSSGLASSALLGVVSLDALTAAAVSLGLGAVSLAAAYLPARRVLRLDPARILRHQSSFRARLSRAHA